MSPHDLRSCYWGHAVTFDQRNEDGSWRAHIFLSARVRPGDRVLAQGRDGDLRYRVIGEVRTPIDPGDLHFVTLMHEPVSGDYYGRCVDCGFTTDDPEALYEHDAAPCPSQVPAGTGGTGTSGHEFVQATAQATYCDRGGCRKHYSEPIHHQRGYTCPNGYPCAVCEPSQTSTEVDAPPEERPPELSAPKGTPDLATSTPDRAVDVAGTTGPTS